FCVRVFSGCDLLTNQQAPNHEITQTSNHEKTRKVPLTSQVLLSFIVLPTHFCSRMYAPALLPLLIDRSESCFIRQELSPSFCSARYFSLLPTRWSSPRTPATDRKAPGPQNPNRS